MTVYRGGDSTSVDFMLREKCMKRKGRKHSKMTTAPQMPLDAMKSAGKSVYMLFRTGVCLVRARGLSGGAFPKISYNNLVAFFRVCFSLSNNLSITPNNQQQ